MADYGERKCKYCLKVFKKRKPLDSYCSPTCQINQGKKKEKKPPIKIKRVSDKRAKQETAYLIANKTFLMEERNKFCPVMAKLYGKTIPTSEVHHINGRENERLLDMEYWIAVSREGHQWIHSNTDISREEGWLI